MKERIEAIIKHLQFTPSQFADAIGVQRSSMSHILSGRNKPSLDFLYKLLDKFSQISGDWLITGKGTMLSDTTKAIKQHEQLLIPTEEQQARKPLKVPQISAKTPKKEDLKEMVDKQEEVSQPALAKALIHKQGEKEVEQIVVFYTDKTFKVYQPD